MVGESLEQHCLTQFNAIRMTAFPTAYFEKDNDAKTGSKGDFIFWEAAEDGTKFISIMFEMKNEMDTTATKHRNEDFFKELDKDRREKGCEYAVLVSLLEAESELYNNGIVDVSYRYPKMYVIRPQFFIPMITLLRNAALNSLKYQRELAMVRSQQLDLEHFEENMTAFKTGFARNYELASRKFQDAIADIDKTIKALEKTKEDLLGQVIGGSLRGLYAGLLVFLIALPFGAGFRPVPAILPVMLLNGMVFASLALVLSFQAKTYADAPRYTAYIITPMAFLCNTFFPTDTMPEGARQLIGALPLSRTCAMMRALAGGKPADLRGMLFLSAYLCVLAVLAVRFVYRKKNL